MSESLNRLSEAKKGRAMKKVSLYLFWTAVVAFVFLMALQAQSTTLEPQVRGPVSITPQLPSIGPLPDLVIPPCRVEYVTNGCAGTPSGKFMIYRKLKNAGLKALAARPNQTLVKWWYTDPDGKSTGSLEGGGAVFPVPAAGLLLNPGQEIDIGSSGYDWFCVAGKKAGTYSFTYVADPYNVFLEKNKGNNATTCAFVVTPEMIGSPPAFDLAPVSIVAKPASGPAATTKFAFDVVVKNIGTAPAPSFGARCEIDANKIGYYSGSLPAGQAVTVSVPPLGYNVTPGTKTIWCEVFVTASGATESNKANNRAAVTFVATP
jgi:hypothetical protein